MDETVCKHNQKGFCKFKLTCRNKHENAVCPEEVTCTSKECNYRHPKSCKNFNREGACRFKEKCAYKHNRDMNQNKNIKDLIANHEKEINAMINEMNQLKTVVFQMENKIMILSQDLKIQ